jgi:hypothetical protein
VPATFGEHLAEAVSKEEDEEGQLQHKADVPARFLPAAGHEFPRLEEKTDNATTDGSRRPKPRTIERSTEQPHCSGPSAADKHDRSEHDQDDTADEDQADQHN